MDNLIKQAGRRRIKDRGIKWEPKYHKRSQKLQERFEKQLGPMSYIRWEGHDYTTDSDYFVIMGPSLTKEGKKRFFAGIKKMPDDPKAKIYAPAGEYFTTSRAALSHVSDKWAVPFPREAPNYTVDQLAPLKIPRHVKGKNEEDIKTAQALMNNANLNYVYSLANNLRNLVNGFVTNLNQYGSEQEALTGLESIQTALQQTIASLQQGSRQTVVSNPQAVQQVKAPLNSQNVQ
jgi:hypothetical protein